MRRLIATLLAAAAIGAAAQSQAHDASRHVSSGRTTFNLNPDWRLHVGDVADGQNPELDTSEWEVVTLPNAFNEKEAFARDIRELSTGIVWYRKIFSIPAGTTAENAFLEFEGVRQAAEIWVNGRSVALSEHGAMAFGADIGRHLRPGANTIAVRVDNDWKYKERATGSGFQWNDRNFNVNYGGITRNVRLHLTGEIFQTLPLYSNLGTTGQYVWASDFDIAGKRATIHAQSQVHNGSSGTKAVRMRVDIRDPQARVISSFSTGPVELAAGATATLDAARRVENLQFWSWGYGYLYTVTTSLIVDGETVDSVDTVTGFRKTSFGDGTIKLNDRTIQVHGYAQRTSNEWPAIGVSIPPWLTDFSNGLMVESGGNLVRWMHITPSKQDVESADRVGLLQAMPAGDAEHDVDGRRWEQRTELMRDAIIYNRNNPSILFYESGNESISEAHMAEMKAIRDTFDPHGGRAIGSREMLDSTIAEYGGEMLYINKSAGIPMWSMEYNRDEGARLYQDEYTPPFHKDSPNYNRNQDSFAAEDVRRWWEYYRVRPGTGRRVSSGGVNIIFSDSNTHFRGDNNYRRSGEVDAVRLPKEGFHAHKVMWSGWLEPETPATHIIGHWNYAAGTTKDVMAVSTAPSVELFLNGRSLGKGRRTDGFLFTWDDVRWEPGTLRAVASEADGTATSHQVETTGKPAAIRLTPTTSPRGFVMDGADIALVDVEVIDARGRRVPTARNLVRFSLDGPAEWRGGIAQGDSSGKPRSTVAAQQESIPGTTSYPGTARDEDNYVLSKTLPVEAGINRVLLKAGRQGGNVTLTAKADGLPPATLVIPTASPKPGRNGLSLDFPEHFQKGSLARGPTPIGDSLTVSRVTHLPVRVTTGSNPDTAKLATDDNELSWWASDGRPETAWAEFRFDAPRTFNEIDLKLVGWRQRSYPLRIEIDGKQVWNSETARTLGYATAAFDATRGQVVRVSMTAPTVDRDAFGNIVELSTARQAGDTGANEVAPGWRLGIVEIDFHGPVAPGK